MNWRYGSRQKAADYRHVFNIAEGERVLMDLCRQHKVFQSTFNADPRVSALLEGERNVVLRILTIMGYSQKELTQLAHREVQTDDEDPNVL